MEQKRDNSELIRLSQSGDEQALEELISGNMGLVKKIAQRFRDRNCEYEDLLQIGTIGMIKAVKSFDFEFNTAFSTYAVPLIIGEIRRFLRDDGIIKVSRMVKKNGSIIMHRREEFIKEHQREPDISELCEITGLSDEEITEALEAITPVRSLQEPIGDEDGSTLGNMIKNDNDEIESLTEKLALNEALKNLLPFQRQIVFLRFYKDLSQQQTGEILGLSQVKISREEKKILCDLRKAL